MEKFGAPEYKQTAVVDVWRSRFEVGHAMGGKSELLLNFQRRQSIPWLRLIT